MTGRQIRWVYETVTSKNPLQLRFEFAMWTRSMIRELIREKFGVRLSEVSVGRMLRKLGLSPQKPLRRAYERDPKLVESWREKEFPKIRELAKKKRATLYFADEAGVRSDFHAGTTWAPKGKTPVVPATGQRFGMNLISAIRLRGDFRFMTVDGRMNAQKFIEFLKRLIHDAPRPVFLIVDRHPSHRAKKVLAFVRSTKGRLRLFFLPPYAPDTNPDEHVWNHLKNHGIGKRAIRNREPFRQVVLGHMRSLQRLPDVIRRFFRDPHLQYILA